MAEVGTPGAPCWADEFPRRGRSWLLLGINGPQESSALITDALRDALAPRWLSCSVTLYSVLTCLANSASRSGPEGRYRLHYCLHICAVENQQLKPTPHCPRLGVPIRQGSVPLNRLPAHPPGTGLMRKENYPPWRRKERTRGPLLSGPLPSPFLLLGCQVPGHLLYVAGGVLKTSFQQKYFPLSPLF